MGQICTSPTYTQTIAKHSFILVYITANPRCPCLHAAYCLLMRIIPKCAWLPYVLFDFHWNWFSFIFHIIRQLLWQKDWNLTPTVLTTSSNSNGCSWDESHLFNHLWGIRTNRFQRIHQPRRICLQILIGWHMNQWCLDTSRIIVLHTSNLVSMIWSIVLRQMLQFMRAKCIIGPQATSLFFSSYLSFCLWDVASCMKLSEYIHIILEAC